MEEMSIIPREQFSTSPNNKRIYFKNDLSPSVTDQSVKKNADPRVFNVKVAMFACSPENKSSMIKIVSNAGDQSPKALDFNTQVPAVGT
jgi:hypothetical protein